MGARSIRMPDVGEGVAEAEIVEWSVKIGDLVREDQVVAEAIAFVLGRLAGLELEEEIAGLTRAPLSTVKSRLYRGLAALKPEVEQLRTSHRLAEAGQ